MPFVLDSSVALAWALPDETDSAVDALFDRLTHDTALAPAIWPLEIGNVLLAALRRRRITEQQLERLAEKLRAIPVEIHPASTEQALGDTLRLAQRYELTTYDAAYLELARRSGSPLATLDARLRTACAAARLQVLPE